MKFLVDNQLPRALATFLDNLGHHAVHVLGIELTRFDDLAIWAYAAQNGSITPKTIGKELSSRRQSVDAQDSSSYM